MNIIFNELRQQRVKYDVYSTSKIKHTCLFYHILFLLLILSAVLIGTILSCAAIQSDGHELVCRIMTRAF